MDNSQMKSLQTKIPYQLLERPDYKEYVEHSIEELKRRGAEAVFGEIYNDPVPTVVETHIEEWNDPLNMCINYQLHYRLTKVLHRRVEIPVFTFANHSGEIEWKCPACAMVNSINASFCGEKHDTAAGCGRPRDKTKQWYENQYAGISNE